MKTRGSRTRKFISAWIGFACAASVRVLAQTPAATNAPGPLVDFSFDQVEIQTFAKAAGEMTGRRFVVDDGVKGRITVVAPRVPQKDVYPLFVKILESAGCSVIEETELLRIVALPQRAAFAAPVVGAGERATGQGIVTKVFRLRYASAEALRKVLEAKISGGKAGSAAALEDTNHLIVTDTAETIRRVQQIVDEIDQPGLTRVMEVVPLRFAPADDLAAQLNLALAESETRAERLRRSLPQPPGASPAASAGSVVVAAPHANSLILVGTTSQIAEIRKIAATMDVDVAPGRGRLNAIFLKYISAEDAAKSISSLLTKSAGAAGKADARTGKIATEASVANNALLVDAAPGDFDVVRKLIDQIDVPQEQVHIEVVIAELTVSGATNLGVEMMAMASPSSVGDSVIVGGSRVQDTDSTLMNAVQNSVFPQGITLGIAHGTSTDSSGNVTKNYPFLVNVDALQRQGRFRVKSRTSLESMNNKEASVNVGDQIPILKSTTQAGTGTARDIIQNIERVDVGIRVKLTPRVTPGKVIQMTLNPTIEAIVETSSSSSSSLTPTIKRREVTTTVSVPSGETIIIAGLTREDVSKAERKVPFLGSIPLIGMLFRSKSDSAVKTEVVIFVTPYIVTNPADARRMSEAWQRMTGVKPDDPK